MSRLNGLTALAVVVSLAAVGLVLRSRSDQAAKLDPARITKVTRGDLELTIDELGKITPAELVAVRSKVAGQVEKVFVDEGMRVKRGQLLLRLEPRDFQRKVVTARHDVARARAVLRLAKLLLDRRVGRVQRHVGRGVAARPGRVCARFGCGHSSAFLSELVLHSSMSG